MTELIFSIIIIILLEFISRIVRLRNCPWYIKLSYGLGLLSRKHVIEWHTISERIFRSGLKNYDQLIKHYSIVSGVDRKYMKNLTDGGKPWELGARGIYRSGMHGLISQEIKLPYGYIPKANQSLKTLTINSNHERNVDSEFNNSFTKKGVSIKVKKILVIGNCNVFGIGATSDKTSLCSRIEYYLNSKCENSNIHYKVINAGMFDYNSFQDYLKVSKYKNQFDGLIVINGWNELPQYDFEINTSKKLNEAKRRINNKVSKQLLKTMLSKSAILRLTRDMIRYIKTNESS